jgi:alkylation response protein AidB-like acyl-CoA dehydrogenase
MNLSLTDDQEMLRDSAARFASQYYSFEHRRTVTANEAGYDLEAWRQFADLGWLAINVPEEHEGLNGGHADLLVLAQALAPAMIVEPWTSTAVLAAELIKLVGTAQQQALHLPQIAAGNACWTLAWTESNSRYNVNRIATTARTTEAGFVLSGSKMPALHLPVADRILVTAAVSDTHDIGLFVVDPSTVGVTLRSFETIDGQRAGELLLDQVLVSRDAALGGGRDAASELQQALDLGAAVLCAEAVGAMRCINQLTTEYLQSRKQFGEPIGRFQALQHRLANMYMAEQRSISAVTMLRYALHSASPHDRQRAVSAAKAQIDKSGRYIGQQSIQLHGGIGITDEYIVGHYFKRLTAIAAQCGDLNFHLDRLARLAA